jgi:hypothetical protein
MALAAAFKPSRLLAIAAFWLLALGASPAFASVTITFYSKELGASFPHAFVTMHGTLDRTGERIDKDYGFTAKAVTPAILMGRVGGEVISDHGANYIKGSDKHFSLVLTDSEYDGLMATIGRWRAWPQPSYDLGTHNCIHFVAELAGSLGMKATVPKNLTRKPRSFLLYLTAENRPWLVARGAVFYGRETAP